MLKIYIFLSIILCYCIFVVYCKIRYRFWSTQPVFHIHNLYYWLFPPGIIQHKSPPITKFFDPLVEFHHYDDLSTEKKELLYRLNKQYYLQDKHISYMPTKESIFSYFKKHNNPCFVALFFKEAPLFYTSKKKIILHKKCIASITSRPLYVSLHQKKLNVNYVDYLCVAKNHRKQGIAPKMIYSYYLHSRKKHNTLVYLFKREGVNTFITPMTVYLTYGFNTHNWKIPSAPLKPLLVTSLTFPTFAHFMKQYVASLPCYIHPSFSHIKYLMEKKLIFIFLLLDHGTPWGCYIFKNPYTQYNNKGMSLDLIASFCSDMDRKKDFISNFYQCLPQIPYHYDFILVENISHNNIIIKNILSIYSPFLKSPTSYYLYNFAYRPFLSKDVFLIA